MRPLRLQGLVVATMVAAVFACEPSRARDVFRATLHEAVERARTQSPALASLRAYEEAAEARLDEAHAARRPIVDLAAGYTRNSDVPEFAVSSGPGAPPQVIFPNLPDSYQSRLGISIPIYTGGRVQESILAAERTRVAASFDRERGDADVVLETTTAYWTLLAARENERVLREAVRSYDAHLADTKIRAEVGLAAANDLLAVQVQRDRAEFARLHADHAAQLVEADLARLLGLDPGTGIEPVEPLYAAAPSREDLEALVAQALESRPDRSALEARIAAADARVRVERSGLRPQIAATAGYDYANPNRKIVPPSDAWDATWDVGVRVSFLLFDGGRIRSSAAAADAESRAWRHRLEETDRRIRLEVTRAILALDTARASAEVAARNLDAARENVRVSTDRYREGLIPSSELLDAETGLLFAGLERTNAGVRARTAAADLDRAVGRGCR
jgi:outer membrane protein TolC